MRCFSSLRCLRRPMDSADASTRLRMDGFPIRRFPGQGLFGSYPRLIAVFRVLLRLLTPRHPPYALSSLTAIPSADGPEKRRRHRITGSIFDFEDKESLCHFPLFSFQRAFGSREGSRSVCISTPGVMVETSGLEPPTSGLQNRRSPS